MRIHHLAIYSNDIERLAEFYSNYFKAKISPKYVNEKKQFSSRFLSFDDNSCKLELMNLPMLSENINEKVIGLAHFSISVGSIENVNQLTDQIVAAGYQLIDKPRTTGDGFYESVIADPDGNRVEITV